MVAHIVIINDQTTHGHVLQLHMQLHEYSHFNSVTVTVATICLSTEFDGDKGTLLLSEAMHHAHEFFIYCSCDAILRSYLIYGPDQSRPDRTSCIKFELLDQTITSTVAHVQCIWLCI